MVITADLDGAEDHAHAYPFSSSEFDLSDAPQGVIATLGCLKLMSAH